MTPPVLAIEAILDEFVPGRTIYVPGASGELTCLEPLFRAAPDRFDGVTLVSCLLPGMNAFDYTSLHAACRVETFLLPPALRDAFSLGRIKVVPLTYSAIAAYLATRPIDVALLHLAPPVAGHCSFGVAADFGPIVARSARRRIGILNQAMPLPFRSPGVPINACDAIVEVDTPLVAATDVASASNVELETIARAVAALVPDGATIQTGIGQAPAAIWHALRDHRRLRLWSGVVSDGFFAALDAGATDPSATHTSGIAHGSHALYRRLDGGREVAFADVLTTHDAETLARIDRLVAINSALEVDLFGQANLEWQGGRLISGAGGAPDFALGACRSNGGRSILALPSTARGGSISRITARIDAPCVSLSRTETDTVVTEFGVAELRGTDMDARAESLIAIAHPDHRAVLCDQWQTIRATL